MCEEEVQRHEKIDHDVDDICGKQCEFFGGVFRHAFRRDLTEDKDEDRDYCRRDGRTDVTECPHEKDRTDRRERDVDDIVSDQDRREQTVVIVGETADECRGSVSVFRQGFHFCFVEG